MGWTSVRSKRGSGAVAMLAASSSYSKGSVWHSTNEQGEKVRKVEIEDLAPGPGGVYGILAITDLLSGQSYRTALVIITSRRNGDFSWKAMTESDGPVACGMPERMFKKLTPAQEFAFNREFEYVQGWRERVQAYHEKKKRTVTVGNIIEFANPLRYGRDPNVVEVRRFRVLEWGRSKLFSALCDDGSTFRCSIRRDTLCSDFTVHA